MTKRKEEKISLTYGECESLFHLIDYALEEGIEDYGIMITRTKKESKIEIIGSCSTEYSDSTTVTR